MFDKEELFNIFGIAANKNFAIKNEENYLKNCMKCHQELPSINFEILECDHEFCKKCVIHQIKNLKKKEIHEDKRIFFCMISDCELIIKGQKLIDLEFKCKN